MNDSSRWITSEGEDGHRLEVQLREVPIYGIAVILREGIIKPLKEMVFPNKEWEYWTGLILLGEPRIRSSGANVILHTSLQRPSIVTTKECYAAFVEDLKAGKYSRDNLLKKFEETT